MNRREATAIAGATVLSAMAGQTIRAAAPARVLILGGTGFIGPHFVAALVARGHSVTVFNRGRDPDKVPAGVVQLIGDRNGQVEALKGHDWDAVIDNSGYTLRQVRLTAQLLEGHIRHYIFISSISAYADLAVAGVDENYKLATVADPNTEDLGAGNYGGLKALCEQLVEKTYQANATVIRPTFIAGPGDPTDRFTYWPVRVARGGDMLVPGAPGDALQFIDVRDLADFICLCVEKRLSGRYNVCDLPRAVTMASLLDASRRITGADTRFVWASVAFLTAQKVIGDEAPPPGNPFPIWNPPIDELAGAALVSPARAVSHGLRFRSLDQTIRDTLAWQKQRPAAQQTLKTGLTPQREAELVKLLRSA
ncbi:MAG TPA: SDR family oxidoreductase [Steroidobacteraceae bacterium]|jgi:2'-hydroxyisoflavone reductase|nr:SDR family oxidoreductase [Steroidobacteraceae bacterium]